MKRVAYLSLGCDKNRVDTERSLGALRAAGFEVVAAPEPAFALMINTCAFIDAAKQEAIEEIMAGARAKEAGDYRALVVVGCLVERYREELAKAIPEVDLWLGVEHPAEIAAALGRLYREWSREGQGEPPPGPGDVRADPFPRFLTTPGHYAFLKIAEGCNSACRYCVIPRIRGKFRSEALGQLVGEARALEAAGVLELNLVAQDTTAWGRDLDPPLELADLVETLLAATSIPWLRILYAHPAHVTDRLIGLLAGEERLCRYLDLPLQHVSDPILAAMGRKPGRAGIEELLGRLDRVPELVLRTAFLVGFPGEGDAEFQELLGFVEQARFFWMSGFVFSPQEGTAAELLPGRALPEEAEERLLALHELQREITAEKLAAYVGRELPVLVDHEWESPANEALVTTAPRRPGRPRRSPPAEKSWKARFAGQAIEVDGVVRLSGEAGPGELVAARVVESFDYDLAARSLRPSPPRKLTYVNPRLKRLPDDQPGSGRDRPAP
jgi:ribosomal protein S12 methylthiotransferase